ncbi:hypothetical protein LINPERPRIM_LOCUS2321 [Linum perenne]
MEPPPAGPRAGSSASPIKVVKRARTHKDAVIETALGSEPSSLIPMEESFRDKVVGFWNSSATDAEMSISDESDVEMEDDDPRCRLLGSQLTRKGGSEGSFGTRLS